MRRLALAAAVGTAVLGGIAPAAHAQLPAPLVGETLTDGPAEGGTSVEIQCKRDGDLRSTGTFTSEGLAVGPYPGTYTESGRLTVETRERTDPTGALAVDFESTFEIRSGETVVTGRKWLVAGNGECEPALTPGQPDGFELFADVRYEAVIHTPDGDFADRGLAHVVAQDRQIFAPYPDRVDEFIEIFESSLPEVEPLQPARPGKGCGDRNHRHERRGECKARR